MRFLTWGKHRGMYSATFLVLVVALLLQPAGTSAAPRHPAGRPAAAQQHNAEQRVTARGGGFSAAVEMIRVPVVVIDDEGAFIRNLGKSNFTVQDGGTSHPVDHFVSDAEPVSVGIIVDASASMAPYTDDVRASVMRAVNNLRRDDELFLLSYGATAETLSPRSSDKSAFARALSGYAPKGNDRALFDAVELGLATLQNATYDKRSLILVGVGADTSSSTGELALQRDIRRAGVTIHAIILADRVDPSRADPTRVNRVQTIPEIVRFTGGMVAQRPRNAKRFGGIDGWIEVAGIDISTYVKHQYVLHYVPMNPPRPGTWRSIRVVLDVDYKQVRARSGYIR